MIHHIDVVNVVLLEECEDVLRGLKRSITGGTVWQHSNPNCNVTGNCLSVTIQVLFFPPEVDKVNGGVLYLSIVKEFNNLRINISPQNATLQGHEPSHK